MKNLEKHGWQLLDGVFSQSSFVGVAKQIGVPIENSQGGIIKELSPQAVENAARHTFSHRFGKGSFPYHTDTAFWPLPVRYLVMRVRGDCRRETRLITFDEIIDPLVDFKSLVSKSIWISKTPSAAFYCSMRFKSRRSFGYRYDPNCMRPVNQAAHDVRKSFHSFDSESRGFAVEWSPGRVLILDNWKTLHARGTSPFNEGDRILERIYVR